MVSTPTARGACSASPRRLITWSSRWDGRGKRRSTSSPKRRGRGLDHRRGLAAAAAARRWDGSESTAAETTAEPVPDGVESRASQDPRPSPEMSADRELVRTKEWFDQQRLDALVTAVGPEREREVLTLVLDLDRIPQPREFADAVVSTAMHGMTESQMREAVLRLRKEPKDIRAYVLSEYANFEKVRAVDGEPFTDRVVAAYPAWEARQRAMLCPRRVDPRRVPTLGGAAPHVRPSAPPAAEEAAREVAYFKRVNDLRVKLS